MFMIAASSRKIDRSAQMLLVAAVLACAGAGCEALAQGAPQQNQVTPADAQKKSSLELQGIQDTLKASAEQRRAIEAEIEAVKQDRAKLTAALIDANAKVQAAEAKIRANEIRLETMKGSEEAIKLSLDSRRAVVGEVLAALQRMGRSPPPAILVRPQDMLQAVRTAMMLGAVLPDLKAETEALAGDLSELVHLREAMAEEKRTLQASLNFFANDKQRLSSLVEQRQSALANAQEALSLEQQREAELAKEATSLKDLIARMESENAAAAKAADAARAADEVNKTKQAALDAKAQKYLALPEAFRDSGRTSPAMPFVEAKALLPLPVSGNLLKPFGTADGVGGLEKGVSLGTRPGSTVASPADGWVSFAGPFRSYGQLLIINAGGGYYILLAGMEKINVRVGQFVLLGEPVASMGDGSSKTASALALGASGPILYVEFRKDGVSIDPGPWWAKSDLEKVRG